MAEKKTQEPKGEPMTYTVTRVPSHFHTVHPPADADGTPEPQVQTFPAEPTKGDK